MPLWLGEFKREYTTKGKTLNKPQGERKQG